MTNLKWLRRFSLGLMLAMACVSGVGCGGVEDGVATGEATDDATPELTPEEEALEPKVE